MAKRPRGGTAEQADLIDVDPPNVKAIKKIARAYKAKVRERAEALAEEKELKSKILAEINAAGIVPDSSGVVKYEVDGMVITKRPQRELLKIKFKKERKARDTDAEGNRGETDEGAAAA